MCDVGIQFKLKPIEFECYLVLNDKNEVSTQITNEDEDLSKSIMKDQTNNVDNCEIRGKCVA